LLSKEVTATVLRYLKTSADYMNRKQKRRRSAYSQIYPCPFQIFLFSCHFS